MNICVVGSGYVGLVTGACLADFGMTVTGVDKDLAKVESLQAGKIPIYEPGLGTIVKSNMEAGRLRFTEQLGPAIEDALVIFIAVGTPSKADGSADLTFVRQVAESIGQHLNGYKVIVTKSTVPIGTGRMIEETVRAASEGAHDFAVVSNPEFLREGSAIEDFMQPDRVVIGTSDPRASDLMLQVYSPLRVADVPFVLTNVESAELIKYASNGFLAAKISFINEVAELCESLGADVEVVARGMGLDQRIGPKFLHPGPGYGGSCFPKDSSALAQIARDQGLTFQIMESVIDVNERTKQRMVDKVSQTAGDLSGKTVALLGLSFKPETDDIRESPALTLIDGLQELGAEIRAFDPVSMAATKLLKPDLTYVEDAYQAVTGADVAVIVTEWNQFRALDLGRVRDLMASPILVDLRNIYQPSQIREAGFVYESIGRPDPKGSDPEEKS